MSDYTDYLEGMEYDSDEMFFTSGFQTPKFITCKYCGCEDLHWKKCELGWRLFNDNEVLHECKEHHEQEYDITIPKKEDPNVCTYTHTETHFQSHYKTSCGRQFAFGDPEEIGFGWAEPKDAGWFFCPKCGKKIEVKEK